MVQTEMTLFQSLIGRLKTVWERFDAHAQRMFQSLIGRLKTFPDGLRGACAFGCFNPS